MSLDIISVELTILLTLGNILAASGILVLFSRERIKNVFFSWGSEFKNEFLAEIEKNPEILLKIAQPLLPRLQNMVMQNFNKQETVKLPLIGKVPRFLVEKGMDMMDKRTAQAVEQGTNTFG